MQTLLFAISYRPGDRVIGTDEGGTYFGTVSNRHDPATRGGDDVLVYWSGEEYSSSSLGHLCPAELLRLWPAAAHQARLADLQTPETDRT